MSVAVSIVLSMGLIRLIGGRRSASETRDWLSISWIVILIGLSLMHWWSSWSFRGIEWTFAKFILMLTGPAVLYLLATIVVSDDVEPGGEANARFSKKRVPLYLALMVYMLVVTFDGYLMAGAPLLATPRLGPAAGFLLAVLGLSVRKPGLDAVVVVLYGTILAIAGLVLLSTPDSIALQ